MKIYILTNKATTNIFGFHTQPCKITRYTNILKLVWGGGGGGLGFEKKEPICLLCTSTRVLDQYCASRTEEYIYFWRDILCIQSNFWSQILFEMLKDTFPVPLSKYRVLCLFYVLLRLNAWCYAVKYQEKICSELSICSPRLHCIMKTLNRLFKIEFEKGELEKRRACLNKAWIILKYFKSRLFSS